MIDSGNLDPKELMIFSIRNNFKEGILLSIKNNVPINCRHVNGTTFLMYAAMNNNIYAAAVLLKRGAYVNVTNYPKLGSSKPRTALDYAKHYECKEIIKLLKRHGAI